MPDTNTVDLGALCDLRTPWCVHVAATLRIAERIEAGTDRIEELAVGAECDRDALHRVLSHLVSKGVFEEPEPGRFTLNDAALGLLDEGMHIGLDLDGIGGRMAHAWGTLYEYVRTGESAYPERFGLPFFEDVDANPKVGESFDALIGMIGHGTPDPDVPITGGWESVRTVVDVGGGTGLMLAEVLRKWPHLHGTLVDLPRAVARSEETFRDAGVSERAEAVGQSFFDPLPSGADVYLLRGILNDWPDREARAILKRCAEAARPNGRVVVLKSVGPEGSRGGLEIEMLLVGGQHRTVTEFEALARDAGLKVTATGRQPSGIFITECRPV